MLTRQENKQLTDAIKVMSGHNINGNEHVSQHNVMVLINNFTETEAEWINRCRVTLRKFQIKHNLSDDDLVEALETLQQKKEEEHKQPTKT